jgi:5,10-methylenetetrahydromethanopterin reductase
MIGYGFFVQDIPTALDQVARADRAGVDTAWAVMHPLGWDTATLAAAALARTERIRFGTSIVPMFTRHPLTLATQASTLAGLAPGRFRLGVGTGNLALMADGYGTPVTRPTAGVRAYLRVLREVLATGSVTSRDDFHQVDATLVSGAVPTPITLAALGPQMFAAAGELADAAMSWGCPLPYLDEVARPAMAKGAAEAGRPVPPLVTQVTAVLSTDPAVVRGAGREALRPFGTNPQWVAMFAGSGFPVDEDGTASDGLVDAVVVAGDEHRLADRLAALAATRDELLVTIQPTASDAATRRAEEDALFRAIVSAGR